MIIIKGGNILEIDVNNPVVKLCGEGIQAELAGRTTEAIELCTRAWEMRKDDYDACIAAHYMARYQENAEDTLKWNMRALEHAAAVDKRVLGFYASLYLNVGKSNEDLGNLPEARHYYELASAKLDMVPDGEYKETLKSGIKTALERVGE
ncbi:hypothetical protein DGWBC_0022 [Dehalogenimonas sp. WBC-2]|nr:hypothetical protein DGWBC_0022 [Dehalogenimonas sp. WBC-2]